MIPYFSVSRRNCGHWDIYDEQKRLFCIRGGPGKYYVRDDCEIPCPPTIEFQTVGGCMQYITDKLMYELIIAEGQEPNIIESWNI